MKKPRLDLLVVVIVSLACLAAVSELEYRAGYADATKKAKADSEYVNEQMANVGFCEWVKQVEFAQYCRSRSAPPTKGATHER